MHSISPIPSALSNSCSRQRACTKTTILRFVVKRQKQCRHGIVCFWKSARRSSRIMISFSESLSYRTNHQHFKFRRIPANVEVANQQVAPSTASLCKSASHINATFLCQRRKSHHILSSAPGSVDCSSQIPNSISFKYGSEKKTHSFVFSALAHFTNIARSW